MHQSSFVRMAEFVKQYLDPCENLTIVDLGSRDINGSYRDLFLCDKWKYIGVDLQPGKNVDLVISNPYDWEELADNSIDVLVSGQALEHIEFFWLTFEQVERKLVENGIACFIVPSRGEEHRYPVDCWRFYPDAFHALAKWANLRVLNVYTQWQNKGWEDGSDMWGDTFAVLQKPERNPD